MQGDALAEPVHHPRLESAAGVDGGVIQDDEPEFFGLGGLGGEGIQHGDGGRRGDRTGHGLKVALVRGTDQSHDIQAGAGRAGDSEGSATRLPGIRDDRRERETALIEVKQFERPSDMALPEFLQARVRRAKGRLVARAFDPSAAAFPAVDFFLTIRRTVCRLAGLPVAWANRACACLSCRGSSSSHSQRRAASSDRVYLHLKQGRQGDAPIPPMRQIDRLRPLPYPAVRPVLPRRPQRFALRFA